MFAVQFTLYRILERFTLDPLADARIPFARTTIEAAQAYMPFGSGMGTFVPVYAMFEKPENLIANTYANRAHNDVLELWLETGALGLGLMGVFAIWFILRSLEIWRRAPFGVREIDQFLARAASLIVILLIAHSLVDYPLRTGAMMAIMAFACALMIEPLVEAESRVRAEPQDRPDRVQHPGPPRAEPEVRLPATARPSPPPVTMSEAPAAAPRPKIERWAQDIEWPEEWRKPPKERDPGADEN